MFAAPRLPPSFQVIKDAPSSDVPIIRQRRVQHGCYDFRAADPASQPPGHAQLATEIEIANDQPDAWLGSAHFLEMICFLAQD
jgi:hypothetical protein